MVKVRKVPMRMCVACGETRAKRELIRVVRTVTGEIKVDPTSKLSGRGAYVCPKPACADAALKERRLEHALEAAMPPTLLGDLRQAIDAAIAASDRTERPRIIGPIRLEQLNGGARSPRGTGR
jgi:uncharacterized protein